MIETKKSGNKTSSGKIDLDIRTNASPNVAQDQVSGGVTDKSVGSPPKFFQENRNKIVQF